MTKLVKASDLREGDKVRIYRVSISDPCTSIPYYFRKGTLGRTLYVHPDKKDEEYWTLPENLENYYYEILERKTEMTHDYEEDIWYPWAGGECPLHDKDQIAYYRLDQNSNGGPEGVESKVSSIQNGVWTWERFKPLIAFKITEKHKPVKEMTVAEISKALGYDVKIVK